MLPAINLRRVPYTGAETSGAETPVPRCPSAEKSQRQNGERRNGGAEMSQTVFENVAFGYNRVIISSESSHCDRCVHTSINITRLVPYHILYYSVHIF